MTLTASLGFEDFQQFFLRDGLIHSYTSVLKAYYTTDRTGKLKEE